MTLGIDRVKLRRRNHIEQTPARKPRSLNTPLCAKQFSCIVHVVAYWGNRAIVDATR
jgi:hypothetical protein